MKTIIEKMRSAAVLVVAFALCATSAWATASLEETGGYVPTDVAGLAFKNMTLGEITGETLSGRWGGDWGADCSTFTFNNFDRSAEASGTITCQAQLENDGWLKGVYLTFTQSGDDVYVLATGARAYYGGTIGQSISSGTTDATGHYKVYNLRHTRTYDSDATVVWQSGEFDMTKVGSDGNEYTITLPASGMSIDETTKNLVVASSGATTGATIDISGANTQKAGVLIKYSSLAAVSDGVSLATAQAVYTANGDLVVAGARTTDSNVLTMKGYWEISNNSGSNYAFDTVPSLNAGSGYFHFYYNDSIDNNINGTFGYAGRSALTLAGGRNSGLKWTNASYSIKKVSVGGPVTCAHSGVTAWPNVVVEKVALFVGDKYTASDIAEFEFTPTAEATIDAEGTYTLAGDNNLFDSIAADGEYVINVNEDATLNIPSATSVNMITFNVAANKTLTLTGNTLTAAGGIKVTGEGKVYTTAMSVLSGPIKGDGTLCYDMNNGTTKPTGLTCTKAAWKGVLWIKNSAYTGWLFKDYGSTASTVRIENVTCYLNGSETLNSTLDLVGEGLKITNGNGWTVETLPKLTGDGSLTISESASSYGNGIVIQDSSEFTGTIGNSLADRYLITFGASGSYGTSGKVVIASGRTATIANGKTWSVTSGFDVSGTLAFTGTGKASGPVTTVNGSTLDLSGFTGTAPAISGALTLVSGTTIKLPAGTTLPYQIASSGSGWIDNVTVQIGESAGSSVAVCLKNGSIVRTATSSTTSTSTSLGALVADANYLINVTGDATITIDNDVSSVGYIAFNVSSGMTLKIDESAYALDCPYEIISDPLTIAADTTKTFIAGDAVEYYQQIGSASTGNGAISTSGTTIAIDNASLLSAGNYTLARWTTPQKLSTGYGYVNALDTTGLDDGLSAELVYMADRIVLRVYDATAQAARGTIKIWPYGDSITEGYNAQHSGQNYRVLLYQKLALLGYNVQSVGCYNLDDGTESEDPSGQELPAAWKWHSAKHGATAGRSDSTASSRGNLEENVDTLCAQAGNPDVVLLHIGINDIVSSDRNPTTVYASISNVISRLESNLPNSIIVVSTVLDVATAAQTGRQINGVYLPTLVDQLNEKIRNGMSAFTSGRVVLADLNDYVKSADDGIIYDGVHPDWWGYDQMAEGWLAAITNNFTADGTFNDAMLPAVSESSLGAAAKAELADYRKGFKRYAVLEADKNILPTLETTIPYTDVNSDAASTNLSKVAYFVEYVRADNNAHKWVWVDMDAFGTTIGDVGLPVAKHQQVVRHLHVKSNHGAIDDVAADSEGVTGFIEFSPFSYGGASGSDSGPKDYSSRYDWNDNLLDSGTYACMQVHRIISTSAKPGGQVLFAFNNWRDSSSEAEFGIGNFSQHFSRNIQTFDYTDTKAISTMNAAAYSVKRIEIWTKPTSEYQSNDLKGSTHADATFQNSERWKITIPGDSGSVKINTIVLGSRSDKNPVPADNLRIQIATAQGTVATSDVMNGDGVPQGDATFADGGYKQTFSFGEDCVLARGTSYELKIVDSDGAYASWPSMLENYDTGDAYSVISNTVNVVNNWRASQAVSASKVYAASMSANIDAFGSLSFSPSLPTDTADRANADLLVNVTDDATLTIGDAMPEVGSIRFSIADGVTLTLADPANINAGEVVVYGPGTLAFGDSATFKAGTDLEFAGAAKVALASGQVLTTTGDIVVGSSATLTLAPATIADLSASLVSAASISGEIAFTAPDVNSDYSITVTATGVVLHRTTKAAFTYNPVPGDNTPTGWITSWGGEPLATTSLRVGPSSDIPYVYHVASGKHPWVGLTARTAGFSYAIYADVSQMESDKGVISAFGNKNKGLFLYRDGDYVKLAHVVNGSITTPSWVPGVAISAGYHLYTVTFDPTTGAATLYLDDGSTYAATDGSTHAHLGTEGLNTGFQLGSVYEGVGDTGFHVGAGLAVCAVRGYDVVLQSEEVETISQSFPATNGNVTWNVAPDNTDNTVIVTSATFGDSNYIAQSKGTLTIPEGSEVNVKHIRVLNNSSSSDRATVNIAGTLNITSTSTNPNTWADRESNKGVLFGHWAGQATYNITGSLIATNTYIETVYTASTQLLDISGGTVKTKALYANNGNSTVKLRDGGTLEVAEILSSGNAITKEFKYGTFRVTADATETRAINFSAAGGYATTLDPYGNTLTLESAALTGSGDITVADSSVGGNGTVVFVGGSSYTGRLILTDDNAANIDISGYTGTVLCQGTESDTIALLDNFAGTVYFTESVDATGVDLSGATVHVAAGNSFTANAGEEGTLVLGDGATVTLKVTEEVANYEGYFPTVSGGGTIGYYQTDGTPGALTGADHVNGNNLMPYYNVWVPSANGENNTISADAAARWRLERLPEANKNVAFKLSGDATVTIDATITYKDVQVYGTGTLTFQQSGNNVMTVSQGFYTTAGASVVVESGFALGESAKLEAAGALTLKTSQTLNTASTAAALTVAGTGALTLNANLTTTSLTLSDTATVNVNAGVTLTVPTLSISGGATLNMMTATSVLADTTSLSGSGTVNWNGKNVDGTAWNTCAEWKGTNVVSGLTTDQNRYIEKWGYGETFVKLTNVKGWLNNNMTIQAEVILENGTGSHGFEISNGGSDDTYTTFRKLSGTGTLKGTGTGGNQKYVFKDVSQFTGSIVKTDTVRVFIISDSGSVDVARSTYAGYLYVYSDGHAKIGDGNVWQATTGGILIAGSVELLGAATMQSPVTISGTAAKIVLADQPLEMSSTLTFAEGAKLTVDPGAIVLNTSSAAPLITVASGLTAGQTLSTVSIQDVDDGDVIITTVANGDKVDICARLRSNEWTTGDGEWTASSFGGDYADGMAVVFAGTGANVTIGDAQTRAPRDVTFRAGTVYTLTGGTFAPTGTVTLEGETETLDGANVTIESVASGVYVIEAGATLTLTNATVTSVSGEGTLNIPAGGVVRVSTSDAISVSRLTGEGVLYVGDNIPNATLQNLLKNATDWHGTLAFEGLSQEASEIFILALYGNETSTIQFANCTVGFLGNTSEGNGDWPKQDKFMGTVKLVKSYDAYDVELAALTLLANGFSSWATESGELSGDGKLVASSDHYQMYKFTSGTNFTGSISITTTSSNGRRVVFGESSPTTNGSISIDPGYAASIGDGATWTAQNGVFVNGTLNVLGDSTIDSTLTLSNANSNAIIKFHDLGTSGARKKLTLGSTLVGYATGCTVRLAFADGLVVPEDEGGTEIISWTNSDVTSVDGTSVTMSSTTITFLFADSEQEKSWNIVPSATGLKLEATPKIMSGENIVGYVMGAAAIVTNTSASVTLPEGETITSVSIYGLDVSPFVINGTDTAAIHLYATRGDGSYDVPPTPLIAGAGYAYTYTQADGITTVALNPPSIPADGVTVGGNHVPPMTADASNVKFGIAVQQGLWYSVEYDTGKHTEPQRAESTGGLQLSAPLPTTGVRYYKILVGGSKAAMPAATVEEPGE